MADRRCCAGETAGEKPHHLYRDRYDTCLDLCGPKIHHEYSI